jgi:arsenite methyltransferase
VSIQGRHDEFADVSTWDALRAAKWVKQLDTRSEAADQCKLRAQTIDRLRVAAGETVIDVGCGTGAMLLDLAKAVGPSGHVVGIEPQVDLAARARERAHKSRKVSIEVIEGKGEALPLASESADAALTTTVLIHLPLVAVEATLREMVRVVRSGGRIAAIEQDCDTWTIDHSNRELTRRIVAFNSDQRSADGWRGRQLRRLFLELGLLPEVAALVHIDPPDGSYLYDLAKRIAAAAVSNNAVDPEEAERWLLELAERARAHRFFSSINYVMCHAEKRS